VHAAINGFSLKIKYNVIQVVPRRTVRPDGIGDYSTLLAQALLERTGGNSKFIVGTPSSAEPLRQDSWNTNPVLHRTRRELSDQLLALCQSQNITAVVLHVSGYGYQNRGVPIWLLEGMRTWHETRGSCRLYGIFHELFATGKPWNSSFWLSGAQKYVTRGLWDLCDGGLATTSRYFDQLLEWRPGMRHRLHTMPVFSNVGEPNLVPPVRDRAANMAVFGQPGIEQRVYLGSQYELTASIAEKLGVLEIMDIGARDVRPPDRLGKAPITSLGELSPNSVSRYLLSCRFGLANYDIARLEKSGVFAAYAAHGVIPICLGSEAKPPRGLQEGRHFLRWPMKELPDFREMQANLIEWYNSHSTAKHANLVASWCLANDEIGRVQAESVPA
jgi:hypothetical protein